MKTARFTYSHTIEHTWNRPVFEDGSLVCSEGLLELLGEVPPTTFDLTIHSVPFKGSTRITIDEKSCWFVSKRTFTPFGSIIYDVREVLGPDVETFYLRMDPANLLDPPPCASPNQK